MSPEEALKFFGSKKAMAEELGVTSQSVYMFFKKGRISLPCQRKIEIMSSGQLKATIRPDWTTKRPDANSIIMSSDDADIDLLHKIGFGNLSLGLSILIKHATEKGII